MEGGVGVVGCALETDRDVRLDGHRFDQRLGEPRLADPRLTGEQDQLALAAPGLMPALEQQRELLVAPDDRGELAPLPRGEAAFQHPLAEDREGAGRFPNALQGQRRHGPQQEQVAEKLPRRVADENLPRSGERLQTRGEVGRVAHHRMLLRVRLADEVAHDHEPGGDADPAGEPLPGAREPRHCRDDREPRPHRPLGLILMCARPTEIGQHPITHELGDVPLEPADLASDRILVGADDLARVLRVEPGGQGGRAHQIHEHDGEPPPFRVAPGGGGDSGAGAGDSGPCARSMAAMAASSLRRWPIEPTPKALRSSAVSSRSTSASMSLARNAGSYRSKPSPRSQAATSTALPPCESHALPAIYRAAPNCASSNRAGFTRQQKLAILSNGGWYLGGREPQTGEAMVQRLAARDRPAAPFASHEGCGVRTRRRPGSFRDPSWLGCRVRTCSGINSLVHLRGGDAGRVRFASRPRPGSLMPI